MNDGGNLNKLTRTESAKKRDEIRKNSLTELAQFLAAQEKVITGEKQSACWLGEDWIALAWRATKQKHRSNAGFLLEKIELHLKTKASWRRKNDDNDAIDEKSDEEYLALRVKAIHDYYDVVMKDRAFTTIMNLTLQQSTKSESVDKLLKYIDTGLSYGGKAEIFLAKPEV